MPRHIELCGFALAVLLGASTAGAQQKTSLVSYKPGRVLGVFDEASGAPIPDAEVTDLFVDGIARTEAHGLVELSRFQSRNDSVAVRIRKLGFSDTALVVMVGLADTVPVQVNLHKAGVALPTVTVNASVSTMTVRRMQEFEDRLKMGLGKYIQADEMRRFDGRNISSMAWNTRRGAHRGSSRNTSSTAYRTRARAKSSWHCAITAKISWPPRSMRTVRHRCNSKERMCPRTAER